MTICDRCGDETDTHIMSMFNIDELCLRCKQVERNHPDYDKAHQADIDQIKAGNYNFKGLGIPADMVALCLKAKEEDKGKDDG